MCLWLNLIFLSIYLLHAVLKVTVNEEDGNDVSVTVRLYGPNTDYVINRERELQVIFVNIYSYWSIFSPVVVVKHFSCFLEYVKDWHLSVLLLRLVVFGDAFECTNTCKSLMWLWSGSELSFHMSFSWYLLFNFASFFFPSLRVTFICILISLCTWIMLQFPRKK